MMRYTERLNERFSNYVKITHDNEHEQIYVKQSSFHVYILINIKYLQNITVQVMNQGERKFLTFLSNVIGQLYYKIKRN